MTAEPGPDAALPPLAEGCPASFGEAGGDCDGTAQVGTCAYREGTCYCGIQMPCSGAALPDDWGSDIPPSWQCTGRPPKVRDDGCPGSEPSGACSRRGQQCTYGACCTQEYTCKGTWQITGGECPP